MSYSFFGTCFNDHNQLFDCLKTIVNQSIIPKEFILVNSGDEYIEAEILKIINSNILEDSKKNLIVMGRNTQLSIEDDNGVQIAVYKVAYGSKLFFNSGDKIKANTKICEWDPYTTPVIAEKSGIAGFVDLIAVSYTHLTLPTNREV